MKSIIAHLDSLLRGERTSSVEFSAGRIDLPLRIFIPTAAVLGGAYGFFMGWYAISRHGDHAWMQVLAATIKLPALFLLTLLVTFPSLYVFNALVGCRLSFKATLRLLVGAIVVNTTVGASFGPILALFTLSTKSYPFMVLLNVILLGIAGMVSLGFLLRALRRLTLSNDANGFSERLDTSADAANLAGIRPPPPLPKSRTGDTIFQVWVFIYGIVGAQMGWILRPFIGHPDMPFTWFRNRQGSFFQSVIVHIHDLFSGS